MDASQPSKATTTVIHEIPENPYPVDDGQPLITARVLIKRVAYLGLSFSLVFTGFNACQAFVTTLFPGSFGFAILFVIYSTFAIGSLFAPLINHVVEEYAGSGRGETYTMAAAAMSYVLFILSIGIRNEPLVLVASTLKGLCSGLMWISQGCWLTKLLIAFRRQQHRASVDGQGVVEASGIIGMATGVFFTIYNLNGIFGNALVLGLLQSGYSVVGMIFALSGVSALGAGMMAMAAKAPSSGTPPATNVIQMKSVATIGTTETTNTVERTMSWASVSGRVRAMVRTARKPYVAYLTPYLFCQGVNMAYTFGNYPNFLTYSTQYELDEVNTPETVDAIRIATAFLLYGFGSMVGSLLWGKVYDLFRSRLFPLLTAHFILVVTTFGVLISTVLLPQVYSASGLFPTLVGVGFLFGLVDFLTNSIINNSVSRNCESEEVPLAFSWYRFCFCIGFAGASAISSAAPTVNSYLVADASNYQRYGWLIMVAVNVGTMCISVVSGLKLESITSKHTPSRPSMGVIVAAH